MAIKVAMIPWHLSGINAHYAGGLTTCLLGETKSLSSQGFEMCVTALGYEGPHEGFAVRRVPLLPFLGNYSFIGYYLLSIFLNRSADLFHAHNSPFLAVLSPSKTLVHLHNEVLFPGYGRFSRQYGKAYYACCSGYIRSWVLKNYPAIDPGKVFLLHNAIDTQKFSYKSRPLNKPIRLLFAGQWDVRKGLFLLLDAVEQLNSAGYQFEVWLAGSPYLWKSEYDLSMAPVTESRVNVLAKKLGNVRIVGNVTYDEMPELYNNVDIFVMPSIWEEPLGIVGLEAMACGLPVVGFNSGGIPEFVENGISGVLTEERTSGSLARSISYLLDNNKIIKKMGRAARTKAELEFSWMSHVNNLVRIYDKILGK